MVRLLLCLDAGSEGGRVLLFDECGQQVAASRRPWPCGQGNGSLARSLDLTGMWQAFVQMVRETLAAAGCSAYDVAAISVTSQRQGVAFLGPTGEVLYAGPNNDLRAVFEGAALAEEHGDLLYRVTGHAPPFLFASARLRWLATHEPERYARVTRLLLIADWLLYRLTGREISEPTLAAESGLFDIDRCAWSDEILRALALDERILPSIQRAGSVAGTLLPEVADELGLRPDTIVAVGAADTQCGLLGMGALAPGDLGAVLGWSGPLQLVMTEPVRDAARRIWTTCHLTPGRWLLESTLGETGNAYRWLRDTLHRDGLDGAGCHPGFAQMDAQAAAVEPGAGGVLAFLGPGIMDMRELRMPLGGFIFSLPTTISGVDQRALIRATLENVAYAVKGNALQLRAISDSSVECLSVGGGMACSALFVQILADVLNMPVRASCTSNVSALGAAMCAAVGAGIYDSLQQAADAMACPKQIFTPRPGLVDEYEEQYARWLNAYHRFQEWSGELS